MQITNSFEKLDAINNDIWTLFHIKTGIPHEASAEAYVVNKTIRITQVIKSQIKD